MRTLVLSAVLASPLIILSAYAAEEAVVRQKDKLFSREDLNLKQGDAIQFVNDDTVTHSISLKAPDGTSQSGTVQKPGESNRLTFDKSGDWRVLCLIHPKMKMSVHVQ